MSEKSSTFAAHLVRERRGNRRLSRSCN